MGKSAALFLSCFVFYNVLSITKQNVEQLESNEVYNKDVNTGEPPVIEMEKVDKEENKNNPAKGKKNTDNPRKPVKLTMKQGLLMNQVLSTYVMSGIKNKKCKKHMDEYKIGLRAFEPWALKMFDSSSKIQAGILYGNLMDYGAFDQCLKIYHYQDGNGSIYGKFCTIHIQPDENLLKIISGFNNISDARFERAKKTVMEGNHLTWSVCVPHSCQADDILPHFNKTIVALTEGINLKVSLNDYQCTSALKKVMVENWEYGPLLYVFSIILAVIIATLLDIFGKKKRQRQHWFVNSFSACANFARLVEKNSRPCELGCLHGIRFLSITYVVYNHRYMARMIYPTVNSFYLLEWSSKYASMIILGGSVCVDTFLLVSGLLLSYNFFDYVTKHGKINWFAFYLQRYFRITIPLSVAVIWNAIAIRHFGSGPLWQQALAMEANNCREFWWIRILESQVIRKHYLVPHTRSSTYIMGLGLGYVLFRMRDKQIKLNEYTVFMGWLIGSLFLLLPVFGTHVFNDETHPYNRLESSLFLSCSRSGWALGVAWIIFSCVYGYGGNFISLILF
ncbi:unnamed protein product [Brassicogethes aeneus]|uniref:Nose resistant-to-fluoxetine protein N-terminal domain-containing protein n=1 Tax=Brassicogethes aeneus TaxID=1431903 RepID=A0A9P0BCR7_BRAAE|nr:unnamed protein product [Brassicogethes aeneus]